MAVEPVWGVARVWCQAGRSDVDFHAFFFFSLSHPVSFPFLVPYFPPLMEQPRKKTMASASIKDPDQVDLSSTPTLSAFVMKITGDHELAILMHNIALACKSITRAVRKAGEFLVVETRWRTSEHFVSPSCFAVVGSIADTLVRTSQYAFLSFFRSVLVFSWEHDGRVLLGGDPWVIGSTRNERISNGIDRTNGVQTHHTRQVSKG